VLEQSTWAIGNITGDSVQHRDLCFAHGALTEVLRVAEGTTKLSCIRNATWTISNFCRGTPKPALEAVLPALPVLTRLLQTDDEAILTDALWSVSYISDGANNYIQSVLDTGICNRIVALLTHEAISVQTPALRTVGNIVTGDDLQTDAVLACLPFGAIRQLLASPKMKIRKECCWLLSNICAGTLAQVSQVLEAGLFDILVTMAHDAEYSVRKEVAFAIANASERKEMAPHLIDAGSLPAMVELMGSRDHKLPSLCLTFAANMREALQELGSDSYWKAFNAAFTREVLENVMETGSEELRERAEQLLVQLPDVEDVPKLDEAQLPGAVQ
ncbi:unnamed protein product, partial [Effrenium voratum]